MTPLEALARARAGDLDAFTADPSRLTAAVRRLSEAGDAASALELVGLAWRVWLSADMLDEGGGAAAAALATPGAAGVPLWYARTLYADGLLAFRSGDRSRSLSRNEAALRVASEAGDVRGECDALTGLARVALREGRYGDVVELASQARERARQAVDRGAEAAPLHLQAAGVRLQGDHAAARVLYLESLELRVARGDAKGVAMEQHNLGWVELHLGHLDAAEARFDEVAAAASDRYGRAWNDLNRAAIALERGRREEAASRFAAGTTALRDMQAMLDPDDQAELDWLSDRLGESRC